MESTFAQHRAHLRPAFLTLCHVCAPSTIIPGTYQYLLVTPAGVQHVNFQKSHTRNSGLRQRDLYFCASLSLPMG